MSLKIEWPYLQMTVPKVGTMISRIKEAIRETFFPTLFVGEDIITDFQKILGHRVKRGGLGIPIPLSLAESKYNTSKVASEELVGYLLGCTPLNYAGYRDCVRGASTGAKKERQHVEISELARQKKLEEGQKRNLHRATRNRECLSDKPH